MAKRKGKLFNIRKPRISIGPKGIKVSAPSVRVGKKTGVNISKSGVSVSRRTRFGTLNSRRGCSRGIGLFLLLPVGILVVLARVALT